MKQRWQRAIAAAALSMGSLGASCTIPDRNLDVASAVPKGDPGRPVLALLWRKVISDVARDAAPQEFASPALALGSSRAEDQMYLGSHSGWFYAMQATTGKVLWKRKLGSVSARALVHRGRIYVGTDDGYLICLDSYGEEQWRYATRAPILQEPVVAGDAVVVANEGDQVYALDLDSGKFRWLYKTDSDEEYTLRGHSGLTVGDEHIYAGFADGSVVALRMASGTVSWMASLRGGNERFVDVDTTPIVFGDQVVAASSSGGLYGLDKESGRIRWRHQVEGGGGLVADDDRLYFVAAQAGVHAFDRDGNLIWRQGTRGGGEPAQPILGQRHLFFSLAEAGLFVADRETGEIVQFFDPGQGISSQPTLGRGQLFVFSNGAVLYSLGLREG